MSHTHLGWVRSRRFTWIYYMKAWTKHGLDQWKTLILFITYWSYDWVTLYIKYPLSVIGYFLYLVTWDAFLSITVTYHKVVYYLQEQGYPFVWLSAYPHFDICLSINNNNYYHKVVYYQQEQCISGYPLFHTT